MFIEFGALPCLPRREKTIKRKVCSQREKAVVDKITCTDCGAAIDEPVDTPIEERKPCPKCGSKMRNKTILLSEGIQVRDFVKARGKDVSGRRIFEVRAGDSLFRLTGKYNHLERKIDWRNAWYYEQIINGETGEIIAYQNHPLTEHRGHGSARKKKKRVQVGAHSSSD
jgi:DNA-directed RNA polymerase subunit RPC12/RpoP